MKKYIAKSHLSINVVDDKGNNIHVVFTPQTGGNSVFYTADKTLQAALERHYRFGHLFRLDPTQTTAATPLAEAATEQTTDPTSGTSETENAPEAEPEAPVKTVTVTDAGSAKDYLATNFGISRTKLKTIAQIKEVAAANGVAFVGI
jgi:hypothetical protein